MCEIVDRVARAIESAYRNDDDSHAAMVRMALAAIEAMRDPTHKMLEYAWDVHNDAYGEMEETPTLEAIGLIHYAMIEEALRT
jgi:hypothetical protein